MQSVATGPDGGRSGGGHAALGWVGTGRMGTAMALRLLRAGHRLLVFNRTASKTAALQEAGAEAVGTPADLAGCDVVFVTVASSEDLLAVVGGDGEGLLGGPTAPGIVVDCSTVAEEASAEARRRLAERGAAFLAAPVSGNPKVAEAGRLTMVVSGPRAAFDEVRTHLETVACATTYVGDGDVSRLVKLCHNLLLGVVIQSLAEITVLAEKRGVRRRDFLEFLNGSVMGSSFTRYKTPALVNLDFKPTFTTKLLRKDFDLALAAGRSLEVPTPVAGLVHELLGAHIGRGVGDLDFAALLRLVAEDAGLALESEDAEVSDGLSDAAGADRRTERAR